MGDYTKVIVNCSVEKVEGEELEKFETEFLSRAYVGTSAYHCGGELFETKNYWAYRTDVSFITQLKYGRGLEGFIDWLRPLVVKGMGPEDCFAIAFTEWGKTPILYFKRTPNDPQ